MPAVAAELGDRWTDLADEGDKKEIMAAPIAEVE